MPKVALELALTACRPFPCAVLLGGPIHGLTQQNLRSADSVQIKKEFHTDSVDSSFRKRIPISSSPPFGPNRKVSPVSFV